MQRNNGKATHTFTLTGTLSSAELAKVKVSICEVPSPCLAPGRLLDPIPIGDDQYDLATP